MRKSKLLTLAAITVSFLSTQAKAQENQSVIKENPVMGEYSIWNGDYEKTICEIVAGYVNKSWICTYESGTQREDFFGDPQDKFLHGMQIGALFTPSFDWGLGLRTGMMFEFYTSRSKWVRLWCNHFSEVDMYIPLHASYRLPITDEIGFNLFAGMGFQWAMSGKYYSQVGTAWTWSWHWPGWRRPVPIMAGYRHEYGNGWPQKVNWQAELGFTFRLKHVAIGYTYSFGIVDHGIENTFDYGLSYETARRSRQDKMQATVAFTF